MLADDILYKLMRDLGYIGDRPTIDECEQFARGKDKNFIMCLDYDDDLDCWMFIVRNIKTDYYYKQPPTPGMEINVARSWGIEHILRRL